MSITSIMYTETTDSAVVGQPITLTFIMTATGEYPFGQNPFHNLDTFSWGGSGSYVIFLGDGTVSPNMSTGIGGQGLTTVQSSAQYTFSYSSPGTFTPILSGSIIGGAADYPLICTACEFFDSLSGDWPAITVAVPEPGASALFLCGLAALLLTRFHRYRAR